MRPDRDELFIEMAQLIATRGTCPRKQVGAVIVRDSRIVSMGYNGAPPGMPHCTDVGCTMNHYHEKMANNTWREVEGGCIRATHAELNAVLFSARQGIPTDAATMYSTCATCATCASSLIASGIVRFVYREPYRITDGLDLLNEAGIEVVQWTQ